MNNAVNYTDESIAAADAVGVNVDNAGLAVMTVLRNYGVDTIFGIPGTHNLEFYRPLTTLGIRAVTTRHEQGAGYGADGWAQQTGLPGVVITTSGPGLLNALSAAGTAYCESRPLIILSPGVAEGSEFADNGALHETKDATGAAGSIVEWSRRVQSAEAAVQAVHDAFELFRYGRPRPVHIEVPLNVLESTSRVSEHLLQAVPRRPAASASAQSLLRAADVLHGAERPVVIAGGGASRAGHELTALVELLNSPVVTTLNGKAAVSEVHPLSLGSEIRLPAVQKLINDSDAVLIIGSKLGEAELWGGEIKPAGTVIRIDIVESQMQKNVSADVCLVGDSAAVIAQLLSDLTTRPSPVNSVGAPNLDSVRASAVAEARAVSPVVHNLASRIGGVIPPDAIVAGDSSQITYFGMTSVMRQEKAHSFLYTPAYATLGYGLPAAIGAKIASPERPVICVIGDGALMFAIQELVTAVEQGIDLTVVCVDNGGYGEINQNERDRGMTPIGVVLSQPNWAALADAFGGRGHKVTTAEELREVLTRAISLRGLNVVHVPLALFSTSDAL